MSDEDQAFTCPICTEDYDEGNHLPRILPCYHSICHICTEELIARNDRVLSCPVCRQKHKIGNRGAMQFQQNRDILTSIRMKSKTNGGVQKGAFPRCEIHNREITMYCRYVDCREIICHKCKRDKHANHIVVEIEDQRDEFNKILKETLKYIKGKTEELHDSNTIVNNHYDVTFAQVKHAREKLLDSVNAVFDEEEQKIWKHKKKARKQITASIEDIEEKRQMLEDISNAADRMEKGSLDTELIGNIKQSIPRMMSEMRTFKGVSYENELLPLSDDYIKNMLSGVVEVDLPLAITVDDSQRRDNQPESNNTLIPEVHTNTSGHVHGMQIFVCGERTIPYDVNNENTIAEVKAKIEENQCIPVGQQRLMYSGKQLQDDKTLSYYGIPTESTLHLVLRASIKILTGKGQVSVKN